MNAKTFANRERTKGYGEMKSAAQRQPVRFGRSGLRPEKAVPGEPSAIEGYQMAADTTAEKRLQRQINNHRENEAPWLQKVLFATGKARDAREKLAEATNEQLNPLITLSNGDQIPLDTLEEIIQKRVDDLHVSLGRGGYAKRK